MKSDYARKTLNIVCEYLWYTLGVYVCTLFRGKTSYIKCKYCRCRREYDVKS